MSVQEIYDVRKARRLVFQQETTPAITKALSKIDGNTWTEEKRNDGESYSYNPRVVGPDDQKFWLYYDEYKHRITVHGSYGSMPDGRVWIPRDYMRDTEDPNPSISADKPADVIARDISRRFLPKYREYLTAYHTQQAEQQKHQNGMRELVNQLVKLAGGHLKRPNHNDERATEVQLHLYDAPVGISYGDFTVANTYVSIKLSVTPDFARKLATMIGGK